MSNPGVEHWKGVKRIFGYVQGTLNYGLLYTSDGSERVMVILMLIGEVICQHIVPQLTMSSRLIRTQ